MSHIKSVLRQASVGILVIVAIVAPATVLTPTETRAALVFPALPPTLGSGSTQTTPKATSTSKPSTEAELRTQLAALLKMVADLESRLNALAPAPVASNGTLEIENVRTSVDGDMAIVSWTTSIASESRLMLDNGDGKVYESKFGTKHEVEIEDLEASQEYEFKITARSKDKKSFDDLYDTFTATKEYQASFVKTKGSCSIVRLEDTAGKAAKKVDLSVSGILATKNGNTARGSVKLRTDSKGEFEYCKPVSTLNIKGGKGMGIDIKLSIPKAGAKATEIPAEKSKSKPVVSECKIPKFTTFPYSCS